MLDAIKQELKKKVQDDSLVDNFFSSFQKISEEFIAQKPIDLLQNVGLFVESVLRVAEHIVLSKHTPLSSKFDVDTSIAKLEKASGFEGLRKCLKSHVFPNLRTIIWIIARYSMVSLVSVQYS